MRIEAAALAGFLAAFGGAVIPLPALAEVVAAPQPEQLAPPRTQNRAQCGWLSATSPPAAASVAPSSNCGS